jgi:CHAD domain-containing protein
MGKASEIVGLECTADALVWAGEVLRARFDEIVELRGAALNSDDIEAVHDLRVATRRLRSALRDFAPVMRKGAHKSVGRDIKNLADVLGTARDLDVAIVALEKLQRRAKEEPVKTGIQNLIDEKRSARERAQLDLMEALGVSAIEDLRDRFFTAIEKSTKRKKNKSATLSFNEAGREAVFESLQEFCRLSSSLYEPFEIKRLHKLRICAKRLRYAIELFTACWGASMAPYAEEVAEMQSYLGEIHDADAWIESISRRLRENEKEISPAHLWLLSRFVRLRTKNYCRAIELWSRWQSEKFIERLRELVLSVSGRTTAKTRAKGQA